LAIVLVEIGKIVISVLGSAILLLHCNAVLGQQVSHLEGMDSTDVYRVQYIKGSGFMKHLVCYEIRKREDRYYFQQVENPYADQKESELSSEQFEQLRLFELTLLSTDNDRKCNPKFVIQVGSKKIKRRSCSNELQKLFSFWK